MNKRLLVTALALGLAAATPTRAAEIRTASEPISGSYVVVLQGDAARFAGETESTAPSVAEVADDLLAPFYARATHVYAYALKGFSVRLNDEQVKLLAEDARIDYVQEDGVVRAVATQSPVPSWGLDRIDQRYLPLNNAYTYNYTGSGVHAYVIDSGIYAHSDFAGRIGNGYTAIADGWGTNDCHGHGTHVSGTIGGTSYGVAKSVTLHPVRVLDCSGYGSWSGVIAGVDWVTANAVKPAVANMSLGGGAYSPLDTAVTNSINSGVTYAVSAGNANANACNYSPARTAAALTVGATTSTDARATNWPSGQGSNWGTCLDLFAPGDSITSSWNNGGTNTISGTSMASPHVAGVAALYLQAHPTAAPVAVASAIINNTTLNVVTNPGTGSPNRLLHSIFSPLYVYITRVGSWNPPQVVYAWASGGTPPYTSYAWWRKPFCSPPPPDPCVVADGASKGDAVLPCVRPEPDDVPCTAWYGPFYTTPPNQWTPYQGPNQNIRVDVTDSAGQTYTAYSYID